MATRRPVGRVAALLGAAVVVLVWGASPAWAAPRISVDPSTDLVDRQVVTVAGGGYEGGTFLGLLMCQPNPASLSDCDDNPLVAVNADVDGGFLTTFPVRRFMQTDAGDIDCARPGACVLLAGTPDLAQAATAPLSFDPDVPAIPPLQLTATVSDRATVDRRSGVAHLTATVSCSRDARFEIVGRLQQVSARGVVQSTGAAFGSCLVDERQVLLRFEPAGGRFSLGDASFEGVALAVSDVDGDSTSRAVSLPVYVVRSK